MATYRLDIEYDGTDWHGWQIQPRLKTIQGALEEALETAMREKVTVTGSGRTDAGVHAAGQVAHFSTDTKIDAPYMLAAINGLVPHSIAIRDLQKVDDDFHSRYDARWRRYTYRLATRPIALGRSSRWFLKPAPDLELMNHAASDLLGRNNCSSYCRTASETENRVCEIYEAHWIPGLYREGDMDFTIRADRYLHGMVRAIVGTLIEIGSGKRELSDIKRLFEVQDRTEAGFAAAASGLTLEEVGYSHDSERRRNDV